MIPQSQISKLSNRLLKEHGGRRIPESVLEKDYCIAWFLVGLSRTPLHKKLAFKGGTALRRCHFQDYRFSEDLDFTLLDSLTFDQLKQSLEQVYDEVKRTSNISIKFSRPDPVSHLNCYTFYLAYEGPLPTTSALKEIKVDITIKEKVYYQPEQLPVLRNCIEYNDLPENAKLLVYPLLEIATEKTIALLDKARTEPRDLYDLWYLIHHSDISINDCLEAIEAKLEYRGKQLDEVKDELNKKEARLKKTWETRLATQMSSLCEFDKTFRAVKRALRQAKLA